MRNLVWHGCVCACVCVCGCVCVCVCGGGGWGWGGGWWYVCVGVCVWVWCVGVCVWGWVCVCGGVGGGGGGGWQILVWYVICYGKYKGMIACLGPPYKITYIRVILRNTAWFRNDMVLKILLNKQYECRLCKKSDMCSAVIYVYSYTHRSVRIIFVYIPSLHVSTYKIFLLSNLSQCATPSCIQRAYIKKNCGTTQIGLFLMFNPGFIKLNDSDMVNSIHNDV